MYAGRIIMSSIEFLPYPCFVVDQHLYIMERSQSSGFTFGPAMNFLELVDSESRKKAERLLKNGFKSAEGELKMATKDSPFSLFTVRINWHKEWGYIICTEKVQSLNDLIETVEKQRLRLSETNFELFEKKEALEESLRNIRELSGPFIKLSKQTALVPLFGTLDHLLIVQNEFRFTHEAAKGDYEQVIFDFHGVGDITEEGMGAFGQLISQLKLMGARSIVTGVKPQHAFVVNNAGVDIDASFIKSLRDAIKETIQ